MSKMFDYDDMGSLEEYAKENCEPPKSIDYLIKNSFGSLDGVRRDRERHKSKNFSEGKGQAYFDKRLANIKGIIWCLVKLKEFDVHKE